MDFWIPFSKVGHKNKNDRSNLAPDNRCIIMERSELQLIQNIISHIFSMWAASLWSFENQAHHCSETTHLYSSYIDSSFWRHFASVCNWNLLQEWPWFVLCIPLQQLLKLLTFQIVLTAYILQLLYPFDNTNSRKQTWPQTKPFLSWLLMNLSNCNFQLCILIFCKSKK